MGDRRIIIGKIGRPHGRDGKARLWLYNDETETIFPGSDVLVEDPEEPFILTIESVQPRERYVIVGFESVGFRDQAEQLTNLEISVSRDRLPEPEEGEFYGSDLVGFDVALISDDETIEIGRLQGFLDNVDTDVLIVTGPRIKGRWLIAMTFDSVAEIDTENERIVLHPLERWAHEDQTLEPE